MVSQIDNYTAPRREMRDAVSDALPDLRTFLAIGRLAGADAEQIDHVKVLLHRVDELPAAHDAHAARIHDALDQRAQSAYVLRLRLDDLHAQLRPLLGGVLPKYMPSWRLTRSLAFRGASRPATALTTKPSISASSGAKDSIQRPAAAMRPMDSSIRGSR